MKSKLPKWPFIAGDVGLIVLAFALAVFVPKPLPSLVISGVVLCGVAAFLILCAPFVLEYLIEIRTTRNQFQEAVEEQAALFHELFDSIQEHRAILANQAQILAAAVDRMGNIEERLGVTHKKLEGDLADGLGKLASMPEDSDSSRVIEAGALQDFEGKLIEIRDLLTGVAQHTGELRARSEPDWNELLGRLSDLEASLKAAGRGLAEIQEQISTPPISDTDEAGAESGLAVQPGEQPDASEEDDRREIQPGPTAPTGAVSEEDEAERVSEKPAAPDVEAGLSEKTVIAEEEPPVPEMQVDDAPGTQAREEEPNQAGQADLWGAIAAQDEAIPDDLFESEVPVISDRSVLPGEPGQVTLVADANIGIGNTLYVRGETCGLSWNEGMPMEFLEIGKWSWSVENVDDDIEVVCRIFKNDRISAFGDDITIRAGEKVEIKVMFPEE